MIGGGTVAAGVFSRAPAQRRPYGLAHRRESRRPQGRREGVQRTAPVPDFALVDDDRLAERRQRSAGGHVHRTRRRHGHRPDDGSRRAQARKPVVHGQQGAAVRARRGTVCRGQKIRH